MKGKEAKERERDGGSERFGERGGEKIRYGEIQAGKLGMAIAAPMSVDLSMQKKTSARRSPSLCQQKTPRYICPDTLAGNISSAPFFLSSHIQLHYLTCSVQVEQTQLIHQPQRAVASIIDSQIIPLSRSPLFSSFAQPLILYNRISMFSLSKLSVHSFF